MEKIFNKLPTKTYVRKETSMPMLIVKRHRPSLIRRQRILSLRKTNFMAMKS